MIAGGPVDVLVTHDATAGVSLKSKMDLPTELAAPAKRTRILLREVVDSVAPGHVFCVIGINAESTN